MLINRKTIDRLKLIAANNPRIEPYSVPLSIGTIITDTQELTSGNLFIPPQGMVLAISKEVFLMKGKKVIGFTTVKNSLSRVGIWALYIGIVDPDWSGPIASVLINFGKQPYELTVGMEYLRMTFQSDHILGEEELKLMESTILDIPDQEINEISTKYVKDRKSEFRTSMDQKFLMLNKLEEEVEKKVKKSIISEMGSYGFSISAMSAIVAFSVLWLNRCNSDTKTQQYFEKSIVHENEFFEKQNKELLTSQKDIKQHFDSITKQIDDLKDSLERIK